VIEPGQAPEKVARRELLEEAGYRARELEFVSSFYLTLGGSSERIFLFFAEVEDADRVARGGGLDAEGEDIEVVEMTETEVWRALDAGEIVDAKTLVGLLSYRQRRGGS
jgi:nudix-type nucleoside diphosphatase (YffH/AdpP family)